MKATDKFKIKNQIWMEPEMFYSEAYKSIKKSASAINTLLRCLQKRKWEYAKIGRKKQRVYTNEGFVFPYTEARALDIAKDTQHFKNMTKLVEVGFIDLVHQGGWYQKHERNKDYSVYKLSERWRKFGTPEFIEIEKTKTLPDSFHVRKNIERKKLKSTSLERSGQLHRSEGDKPNIMNNRLQENEVDKLVKRNIPTLAATA